MIDNLRLVNFRKATDSYMVFTPGLNVIRGNAEASKSTRFEAIAYALFGARALRESLAETVTWGQPESSLKVVLNFTFDGVQYNLYRAKSGCELTYDGGRVTGQNDVTRFVENLFGVNADTAGKLFLSSQNSLRGALTAGPTATVELIETLAGFSLMDDLVEKIQEQLPCGNTSQVEDRIVQAQAALDAAQLLQEPVMDPSYEQRYNELNEKVLEAEQALKGLGEAEALELVGNYDTALASWKATVEKFKKKVVPVKPTAPLKGVEFVKAYRDEAARVDSYAFLRKEKARMPAAQLDVFEGSRSKLEQEVAEVQASIQFVTNRLLDVKAEIREDYLRLINEDVCAFCKKSLKDVPEVISTNEKTNVQIAIKQTEVPVLEGQKAALEAYVREAKDLLAIDHKIRREFAQDHWKLDESVVPVRVLWNGGDVPNEDDEVLDYWKLASDLETAHRTYAVDLQVYERSVAEWEAMKAEAEAFTLKDPVGARAVLEMVKQLKANLTALSDARSEAKSDLRVAQATFEAAVVAYQVSVTRRRHAEEALDVMKGQLHVMIKHNELIKKIRAARPVVAASLWGAVLSSISHYFSQIRGEHSVVTRTASGFSVNGRGIAGLSGSTLDSLGLALRLAVTKTFLPGLDFLMLDEPAAACDADREINMLGVIAAAEFPQALVVTHSDLADSFAANLINLE